MTVEAFIELCRHNLKSADFAQLEYCAFDAPEDSGRDEEPAATPSGFINAWRKRERTLRLTLAAGRAGRIKWDGPAPRIPASPHDPTEAEVQARAALAMDNPLEAEVFLDKGRWDAIENLQGTDYFGVNTIYAYLLKLRLLERRSLFKTEEGFSEYKTLYASITETGE
jgi:hypothetical protein